MSSDKAAVHLSTAEISHALLADERQRNLCCVWLAACERSGQSVPARADIDITELRECIGNLLMLQVEDGGRNFRYLVLGTQVARDYGQDLTGERITDIPNDSSETLLEFYRAVYRERRPYFSRMNANLISFVDTIERFMLPLTNGGDDVSRIIFGCYPLSFRRKPDQFLSE